MFHSNPTDLKIAFVDYENVGTLKKLDLSPYAYGVVLVGARQHQVTLKSDNTCPLMVIKVPDHPGPAAKRPKNNLDFHLAYYLGRYDTIVRPEVTFEIISSDRGFLALVEHIVTKGRVCIQIGVKE